MYLHSSHQLPERSLHESSELAEGCVLVSEKFIPASTGTRAAKMCLTRLLRWLRNIHHTKLNEILEEHFDDSLRI
jgi:predicted component of type VI protein secretion system